MSAVLLIFSLAFISAAPISITNCVQLQSMKDNLAGDYVLANNIDCSDTINWNGGEGFIPVGKPSDSLDMAHMFTGSFDGAGYKITDLYINRPDETYVGLFGYAGYNTISNLVVESAVIIGLGEGGDHAVGTIGVLQYGTLNGCSITDTIIRGGDRAGGIAGVANNADIYDCIFDGIVIGYNIVGAGVGFSAGDMYNTNVSGEVYGMVNYSGLYGWTDTAPGYVTREYVNCFSYVNLYYDFSMLALIAENHELRIELLEESQSSQDNRLSLLESWKQTLVDSISSIPSLIEDLRTDVDSCQDKIDEYETRISELEEDKADFPNYFKYLSSGDRKAAVCGYAIENKMTSYADLGWNCTIKYRTYNGRTTSTCTCKMVK